MKIKPLTKEQLIISTDRLTRFKHPEVKYLRVFKEIILNNLIEPKFKKSEFDNQSYETIKNFAQEIINYSSEKLSSVKPDYLINKKLSEYENSLFNLDVDAQKLIDNKINYSALIEILPNDLSDNLKFLKSLSSNEEYKGMFPIKKLILCEGITEEILLPEFAKICDFDFSAYGIYIISAGGKNQVVKYFYDFVNSLKIPIFVLLDSDADENYNQILPKLRTIDKIHIIKGGEFEDILPRSLIFKTIDYTTKNISTPLKNIDDYNSTVEFLEEFYRHRGLHEFKKSEFAQNVKSNIHDKSDLSQEILEIFEELSR